MFGDNLNASFMSKRKKTQILKAISRTKRKSCSHIVFKKWKSLDAYGKKVQFTFKGKKSY